MTPRTVFRSGLVLLALGCAAPAPSVADATRADCLTVCNRANACPGASSADCAALCSVFVPGARCLDLFHANFACVAAVPDAEFCMTPLMACEAQMSAVNSCGTGDGGVVPDGGH